MKSGREKKSPRLPAPSRGALLIPTLWTMSIFSALTLSLVFGASQDILLMKRELQNFKDRMSFLSLLNSAYASIASDTEPHEDSPEDAWYGALNLPEVFQKQGSVMISDEESKLNINEVSERALNYFFKTLEKKGVSLYGESKNYVKAIIKLRQTQRIQSLQELLRVEDFNPKDLEILKPYMTPYTDHALININTALPWVLESTLEAIPADPGMKKILEDRIVNACGSSSDPSGRCFFVRRELTPERFSEKLRLPKTPVMISLVQEFLSKLTTDSETFCAVISLASEAKAESVFRLRSGAPRAEVLFWNEWKEAPHETH